MCPSCLKLGIKQFNTIVLRLDFLIKDGAEPTGNTASILAPVKVTVERLHCMIAYHVENILTMRWSNDFIRHLTYNETWYDT